MKKHLRINDILYSNSHLLFHTSISNALSHRKFFKNTKDPETGTKLVLHCTPVFASRSLNISIATRFLARNTRITRARLHLSYVASANFTSIPRPPGIIENFGGRLSRIKRATKKENKEITSCPLALLRHEGFRGTCSWRHAMHTSCGVTSTATGGERERPRIISSICGAVSWSNRGRNHGPKEEKKKKKEE